MWKLSNKSRNDCSGRWIYKYRYKNSLYPHLYLDTGNYLTISSVWIGFKSWFFFIEAQTFTEPFLLWQCLQLLNIFKFFPCLQVKLLFTLCVFSYFGGGRNFVSSLCWLWPHFVAQVSFELKFLASQMVGLPACANLSVFQTIS